MDITLPIKQNTMVIKLHQKLVANQPYLSDGVLQRLISEPEPRQPQPQPHDQWEPALQPGFVREPLPSSSLAFPPQHFVLRSRIAREPVPKLPPSKHAASIPNIELLKLW